MAKTLREKLEGPAAMRELLAASWALVHVVEQLHPPQTPIWLLDAKNDLRAKLERLDEIRTGRS